MNVLAARNKRRFQKKTLPLLDSLYAGALRMTRNPADAEDLLQEKRLKAGDLFRFDIRLTEEDIGA